jgi:Cytochrome P460
MSARSLRVPAIALPLVAAAVVAAQVSAGHGGERVKFPSNYAEGVLYALVARGNIKQEICTSREAIDAVRRGDPLPSGTVITLVDSRDGKLFRYVVMEKRTGWGADYPPEKRNGEWEYQAFNADKSVNHNENLDRCFSCHKSQAQQDFVWTLDRMRTAK